MSFDAPSVEYVHSRFAETFGPPLHTLGKDSHWALRLSDFALPVNVLLNGTLEMVALWVFDPILNSNQAVFKTFITRAPQIDEVIKQIQERMSRADLMSNRQRSTEVSMPPSTSESPA